jgi:hypothetical protein
MYQCTKFAAVVTMLLPVLLVLSINPRPGWEVRQLCGAQQLYPLCHGQAVEPSRVCPSVADAVALCSTCRAPPSPAPTGGACASSSRRTPWAGSVMPKVMQLPMVLSNGKRKDVVCLLSLCSGETV